jgi:hypothetical protein
VCVFHLYQALNRIRLDIIINDGVVVPAQQDQIFVPVSFYCRLMLVVTRALRVSRLDMANFSDDSVALNNRFSAFGKCTLIA